MRFWSQVLMGESVSYRWMCCTGLLTVAAPMGYNSWYDLMCSPYMNETTLERTADAMIEKGLVALGYVR